MPSSIECTGCPHRRQCMAMGTRWAGVPGMFFSGRCMSFLATATSANRSTPRVRPLRPRNTCCVLPYELTSAG
eukprot:11139605-Heterocapsa_arctica.AAC.1